MTECLLCRRSPIVVIGTYTAGTQATRDVVFAIAGRTDVSLEYGLCAEHGTDAVERPAHLANQVERAMERLAQSFKERH